MTVVHNAHSSASRSAGRINHFAADGVYLSTQLHADAIVVEATGELDACNLHHLVGYVQRSLSGPRPLVVDLSRLDFLAAQGVRTLFEIDDECGHHRIDWALLPSRPVTRLLEICDTNSRLPVVSSTDEALQRFSAPAAARRLLQLVTKSS